jgi:aerobic carbon-monoxide dehydrogenase medium subunit
VIPAATGYVRPESVEDAVAALADPEAKLLAGGQSLLPLMKLRVVRPALLVDIGGLDLSGLSAANGELRIGALTTWDELAGATELERPALAGLADCARVIGDLQVRNRGTVGGSLAHADPSADAPAALLALGATVELRSTTGTRSVPVSDFLRGPFTTALEPNEILTEVIVAEPEAGCGSAYEKVEHPASGFALAGAFALVRPDASAVVALTGIAAHAVAVAGDVLQGALGDLDVFGDDFAPAEYRRHLAGVVAGRALERARARASEDAQ